MPMPTMKMPMGAPDEGDERLEAQKRMLDELLQHSQGQMAAGLRGPGGTEGQSQPEGQPDAAYVGGDGAEVEKSQLGADGLPAPSPEPVTDPTAAKLAAGGDAEPELDEETIQKLLALLGQGGAPEGAAGV